MKAKQAQNELRMLRARVFSGVQLVRDKALDTQGPQIQHMPKGR